uniref:Uncharacterized protein n=1 Tax=Triticum urartu TaxID=4572 RepID=A0A8R7PX91_TRIUA
MYISLHFAQFHKRIINRVKPFKYTDPTNQIIYASSHAFRYSQRPQLLDSGPLHMHSTARPKCSATQVHEVGPEQEGVADPPPLGREHDEQEADDEADDEGHGVHHLPGRAGVVAPDDVVVGGGEGHEGHQGERGVEQVRPPQPVPLRLPRRLPPAPPAGAERRDTRRGGHAVAEPARGGAEAVGEREEDAGGGAEQHERAGEHAVDARALAVVGDQRREDGEGQDGGRREEHVEPGRAAQDEVHDQDEARGVVSVVIVGVLVRFTGVFAGLIDEHLVFFSFLLSHRRCVCKRV